MTPTLCSRSRILVLSIGSILVAMPTPTLATSLAGFAPPSEVTASSPKDATVKTYVTDCVGKAANDASCEKVRKQALEILKEDILTLGSTANREFLPTLLKVFKSEEPELRIAVLDAIGMIGPTDSDVPMLARMANDRYRTSEGPGCKLSPEGKEMPLVCSGNDFCPLRKQGSHRECHPMPASSECLWLRTAFISSTRVMRRRGVSRMS
ncbi:MAG: hypothetical protein A49_19990 [Methyloceanibacter sp.]|nr:MAG: hypothetical protein A49_19990 [Methyloceanibacter sp.]